MGSAFDGTIPVQRLDEFPQLYGDHPEEKMADATGAPAGEDTRGILQRLHVVSGRPTHIGKEVDPLDEEEDVLLIDVEPTAYHSSKGDLELQAASEILSRVSALKAATILA